MEITEEADDAPDYDPRTPEQIRYDAIGDQVREATRLVREVAETVREFTVGGHGNVQTVIHKTEGMGIVGGICASICVLCVVFIVVIVIFINGALRDLWAWKDVHANDIAALKAQVQQLREKTK